MKLSTVWCKGRARGLFSVAVLGWSSPVWSLDCSAPAWGAQTGVVRSHWEEFSAQGKSLVRERGTLTRAGINVGGACERWQWRLDLTRSEGRRRYDGVSTTHFPIQTSSNLAITDASVQGWAPMADRWSAGLRLNHRALDRDIAGTGPVLGYPERFAYWQTAAGIRHERPLGPGVVLSGEGWLGGGPGGTLSLQLPHADPAQLKLGRNWLVQIGLQLGSPALAPERPGWSWQLRMDYQWQQIVAGPAMVIMRNGVPIGGASQPETRQTALGVDVGMHYRF
ncbi:MAG: hypothetical protein JJD98_07615 [Polaromonas sp.]|nr:hypothetical protein [Polaromonas sp.]